ncbi:MAG: hypothetical protein JNJ57_00800 [Saprospiraceae bacterium]|nr:hypothetical protein [Saprospiraceae bacterium]
MNPNWQNLLVLGAVFLALFVLCEYLFHRRNWDAEHTRKVAHAGSGILALSFPFFLDSFWQVALLCGLFLLILAITKYSGLLRSIHAISRVSYGSTMFPVVVSICFWRYSNSHQLVHFYLPVLIMALADPAACLFGKKMPIKKLYLNKSLGGALAFFAVACTLSVVLFYFLGKQQLDNQLITRALLVGIVTTAAEAFSGNGFDNLTIPMAALLVV